MFSPVSSLPVSLPLLGQLGGLARVARGCSFSCLGPIGLPSALPSPSLPAYQYTPSSSIKAVAWLDASSSPSVSLRLGAPEGREPVVVPVCSLG